MTVRQILYDWGGAIVWLLQVINLHSLVQLDALMKGISGFGSYWNLPWVTGGWLAIAMWLRKSDRVAGTAAMRQLRRLLVGAAWRSC